MRRSHAHAAFTNPFTPGPFHRDNGRVQQKLDDKELKLIQSFVDHALDGVMIVDSEQSIVYYNRAIERILDVRLNRPFYRSMRCRDLMGLEICDKKCIMQSALSNERPVQLGEISGHLISGRSAYFYLNAVPLKTETFEGALIYVKDVSEEAEVHEKYKSLLTHMDKREMAGNIQEEDISSLVQLLLMMQKTGALTVSCSGGEGVIYFEKGNIVSARLGKLTGTKALQRIFRTAERKFEFSADFPDHLTQTIDVPTDHLLLDILRDMDELSSLGAIPQDDEILVLPETAFEAMNSDTLSESDRMLLVFASEAAPVVEVLNAMTLPDPEIYKSLVRLKKEGLIAWVEADGDQTLV